MSKNFNRENEPLFGKKLYFLNHVTKVIFHNYFLIAVIALGGLMLVMMANYVGIGGALGTGIGYGLIKRKTAGFIRGFLIGAALVTVVMCWGQYQ